MRQQEDINILEKVSYMKILELDSEDQVGKTLASVYNNAEILRREFKYHAIAAGNLIIDSKLRKIIKQLNVFGIVDLTVSRNMSPPTTGIVNKLLEAGFSRDKIIEAWNISRPTFYRIKTPPRRDNEASPNPEIADDE